MDTVALHARRKPVGGPDHESLRAAVPPEVAAALRGAGVHEWRISLDGDDVFHLVGVEDYRDPVASPVWSLTAQLTRPDGDRG